MHTVLVYAGRRGAQEAEEADQDRKAGGCLCVYVCRGWAQAGTEALSRSGGCRRHAVAVRVLLETDRGWDTRRSADRAFSGSGAEDGRGVEGA